jgi:hypothetical protein
MRHLYSVLVAFAIGLMFLGVAWCSLHSLDQTAANHFSRTADRLEQLSSQDMSR